MTIDRHGARRWRGGLAATVLVVLGALSVTTSVQAGGLSDVVVVRGELERLERQAYDYLYRNSNRNVFRRSRHYHPTQNVFRSSQYYKRRLAASFSGYPLRTTYRDGYRRGGRRHGHEESYVYPRRSPYGPSPDGLWYGSGDDEIAQAVAERAMQGTAPVDGAGLASASTPVVRPRPRDRWEIETVPVRLVERRPTNRAVMRTTLAADGVVRTVITSERVPATIDHAWTLLARDRYDEAADLFARLSLESADGGPATVGYALARAAAGEGAAAATALRRAVAATPGVLASPEVAQCGADLLERIERRYAPAGDEAADADHTLILSAVRTLRRESGAPQSASASIGG